MNTERNFLGRGPKKSVATELVAIKVTDLKNAPSSAKLIIIKLHSVRILTPNVLSIIF